MHTIGIVGSGPEQHIPDLLSFKSKVDIWIGVDRGALTIIESGLPLHDAVGDFDSVTKQEMVQIQQVASNFDKYLREKDQTDLEIAINKALFMQTKRVYLFGITGGRLDHEFINVQQLLSFAKHEIKAYIVDDQNVIQLFYPGTYTINHDIQYPYISFIPFSQEVKGFTLKDFYYPLENETITWGSTLCLSNELVSKRGTFLFREGILLVIKSRDS